MSVCRLAKGIFAENMDTVLFCPLLLGLCDLSGERCEGHTAGCEVCVICQESAGEGATLLGVRSV